jgi:transposase
MKLDAVLAMPLGHVTITEHMHMSRDDEEQVRRIEVFTGAGRRRSWSDGDKARIVAESYVEGETVSGVARRHGMTAQQLFGWRRAARVPVDIASPVFVPAVVEAGLPEPRVPPQARATMAKSAAIELDVDGVAVRISRGADARTVTAVLRALKATR